jgi:hypothetical protein
MVMDKIACITKNLTVCYRPSGLPTITREGLETAATTLSEATLCATGYPRQPPIVVDNATGITVSSPDRLGSGK